MKKSLLTKVMLLLCALVAGSSSVWADDELYYTLTPTAGSDNNYANSEDIEVTDASNSIKITWNVTGNATMTPWRLGGKSLSSVDRAVYSKTAMGAAITEVKLEVGGASSITVNSLKLIVSTAENGGGTKIDEVSGTFAANSTISFKPTAPATQWAKDAYYKFVFNVTVSVSSNKFVEFKKVEFYTPEVAKTDPSITFNDGSVRVGKTLDLSTLFDSNSAGAVTYSITAGDSYATIDGSTLTAGATTGDVTIQASQAATLTYNAKTATATISVIDPALSSIAITTAPTTTTYDEGDLFDETGMVVTATFANGDTEDVTASCTWSPNGALETSDTEVTISYTYKGVTKTATQDITVNEYVQPTSVSVTNWNTVFGTSFDGSITGDDQKTYNGEKDKVTISYAKGTGSYMYMKNGEVRLYGGTILSFTAPYGYCIKQIVFTGTIEDGKKPTANVGTYNNSTKTWTGAASTVVFTGTASNASITSATITLSTTVPVTIASSGYSTLATTCGLDFANATPAGLEAYVASAVSASAVTLTAVNEAPASTGVILKGTADATYSIPVKTTATFDGTNYLKAAVAATTLADGSFYILKGGKFCIVEGAANAAARTVPAGKAYLLASDVTTPAPQLSISFGGETTGINTLNVERETLNGAFYNLAGQRVAQPSKGLYIVNGKKVIVK